jgi:hypothetical protein
MPVFQQFLSMHHRPFPDQIESPAWQLAFKDLEGADVNGGFELAVSRMKMAEGDH